MIKQDEDCFRPKDIVQRNDSYISFQESFFLYTARLSRIMNYIFFLLQANLCVKIKHESRDGMKKMFILIILLLIGGCTEPETKQKDDTYFLFATPLATHTLWLQAKDGMETACKELDIHCDWKGPIKISVGDMIDVINTGLLKKADGIITQGVMDKELIAKGMAEGVPIVLVDSPIKGSHPLVTFSKDFDEQAALLLQDIEKKIGKHEYLKIGIQVSDKSFDLAKDQVASIQKVFKKHPGGFEIVAQTESRSDQLTSKNEWTSVFRKNTGMNISINLAGENAIGCVEAKEYMKNTDTILIYAVDDMNDTISLIKEGKIQGSIVTSFYQYGYESVHVLYDYVKDHKKPSAKRIPAKIMLVNKDNIKTYKKDLQ